MSVYVDDLTEEQIEAIVAARRAVAPVCVASTGPQPLVVSPETLAAITAVLATPPPTRKRRPEPDIQTRMCSRCGIDTTAPDLCRDCLDVLADEVAA